MGCHAHTKYSLPACIAINRLSIQEGSPASYHRQNFTPTPQMLPDWITSHARVLLLKWKVTELFHQVASSYAKFIGTNECFYTGNRFNSYKIGLGHQHGCRFTVLGQMPSTWRKWRHVKKALFTIFAETTMHLNYPLPPSPPPQKKKRNHCFHFLLGITVVPRQIEGMFMQNFGG